MDSIESLASAVREYRDLTHDTANKAADALELLGMVERHGWQIDPARQCTYVGQTTLREHEPQMRKGSRKL